MNSTDSIVSPVRIVTHWRRFSSGLWRVPEGDIAAAYSASILPSGDTLCAWHKIRASYHGRVGSHYVTVYILRRIGLFH
jgi:hypothetical protein